MCWARCTRQPVLGTLWEEDWPRSLVHFFLHDGWNCLQQLKWNVLWHKAEHLSPRLLCIFSSFYVSRLRGECLVFLKISYLLFGFPLPLKGFLFGQLGWWGGVQEFYKGNSASNTLHSLRIVFCDGTLLDTADEQSRAAFRKSHPLYAALILSPHSLNVRRFGRGQGIWGNIFFLEVNIFPPK